MREFRVSTSVNASPDHVWTVLADVERWSEWTASMSRIEVLSRGALGVGSQVRIKQPKLMPGVWTITKWQPGTRLDWESNQFGLRIVGEHVLSPIGTGCTVTLILTFHGLLGSVVGFLGGNLTRRYMNLELTGIKTRSEETK